MTLENRKQKTETGKSSGISVLRPPSSVLQGFTLVETLVAIAIMMIAIAGPLYTADRAILAAEISRDQLIASYLAQEGIEYVRMMRDNAFLAVYPNTSNAWTSFISQCSGSACIPALIAPSAFANFSRSMNVTSIGTDARVTSTVSWTFHDTTYSVTSTDHLTPWQ